MSCCWRFCAKIALTFVCVCNKAVIKMMSKNIRLCNAITDVAVNSRQRQYCYVLYNKTAIMWYVTRSNQHWYITNYQWDHATASRTTNGITPAASRTTNGITPRHHQLPMGSCQLHHETTNGITPLHHELPVGSCRLHHEIPLGSRHCITNYHWDHATASLTTTGITPLHH